ncbi:MAG TPA: DUF2917 domain-containing protein [Ramlibacter sp.]|nr:DUF2917 domain-containing protein [Ramlibacter sp.]
MTSHCEFGNSRLSTTGGWLLGAGRVVRLCLREERTLRATQGSLWITFDGASPTLAGDYILRAGERMRVPAGRTVVLSASGARGAGAAFDWQPVPRPVRNDWRAALLHWLAGFGLAAGMAR